jgi:hypothetical protein
MTKNDMMALIRSVAVPNDVEEGMSHAYDLGVEWVVGDILRMLEEEKYNWDVQACIDAIKANMHGLYKP